MSLQCTKLEYSCGFDSSVGRALPSLLGYRDTFDYSMCNKVILDKDEISDSAKRTVFAMTLAARSGICHVLISP